MDARHAPRIAIDGFCGVVSRDQLRHATMRDLSFTGCRVERVFDPAQARKVVQLEIELPGVDEIIWATAAVTRAYLTPLPRATPDEPHRFWCRAGLHLTQASRRERRVLMDYVAETLGGWVPTSTRTLGRAELASQLARAPRVA
jgi:hypothetical protein